MPDQSEFRKKSRQALKTKLKENSNFKMENLALTEILSDW